MEDEDFDVKCHPHTQAGIRASVVLFSEVLKIDEGQAQILLISSVATCLAMLTPGPRVATLRAMFELIKDIETESFEDGVDFVSLLREKQEERKNAKG